MSMNVDLQHGHFRSVYSLKFYVRNDLSKGSKSIYSNFVHHSCSSLLNK